MKVHEKSYAGALNDPPTKVKKGSRLVTCASLGLPTPTNPGC